MAALAAPRRPEAAGAPQREFEYTDRDFRFIRELVARRTGITLTEVKRNMVYSRLSRRLRRLGLRRFRDYCALLEAGDEAEMVEFINAITTNLTAFFREPHHFDFLGRRLLPELAARNGGRVRIWSAGCSTGEEPYSIAITAAETLGLEADVRILATDLDSNVLATGEAGIYPAERVAGLPRARLHRWFRRGRGAQEGRVRVAACLRRMVRFRRLNLMDPWPMKGPLDVIFCRNVVIYFSKDTQRRLFDRFADILRPDGHLFVGHSESLYQVTDRFRNLGRTVYQRCR